MVPGNRVIIHTLGPRSRQHAERMAADRDLRFAGDHFTAGPYGIPIINDVTAWMLASVLEVHPVHANAVVIVQIEDGALGEPDEALLYHERTYMRPSTLGS